jgi:hypothetical protein
MDMDLIYTAWMWSNVIGILLLAVTAPWRKRVDSTAHIAPLIIGGGLLAIKGVMDFLGNKSKADAEKAARVMYNEWLKDRSQTAQDIAAKLAERGIDIYGPQVTTTSASGTSSGTSQSRTVSNTSQVVDPAQAAIKAKLEELIMGKLGTPEQITEGEKAAMLEQIGQGERAGVTDVTNRAAKMNLGGTSLQSAMLANPVTSAANYQRSQYLGSEVPQQNRELADKSRAEASGLLNAWKGAKNVSNTSGSTTGTFSNTGTSTAPPNYNSLLAFLSPPAPGASTQTGWNPAASAGSDLAGSLLQLWMNQQSQPQSGSSGGGANSSGGWVFENGSWVWKG